MRLYAKGSWRKFVALEVILIFGVLASWLCVLNWHFVPNYFTDARVERLNSEIADVVDELVSIGAELDSLRDGSSVGLLNEGLDRRRQKSLELTSLENDVRLLQSERVSPERTRRTADKIALVLLVALYPVRFAIVVLRWAVGTLMSDP